MSSPWQACCGTSEWPLLVSANRVYTWPNLTSGSMKVQPHTVLLMACHAWQPEACATV
jgi:hypothetical protein